MFDEKTRCLVVVGAQWGDEGKGKLVDILAERADFVVRYQGGANAGHTVVTSAGEFILHQIPSGILHSKPICIVGNGVVLDPETFFHELDGLESKGIAVADRLFVSERTHLVMPYHKLLDAAVERTQKIGTTGRGIGPTYEEKVGRRGIRVADLRDIESLRQLLRDRIDRANRALELAGAAERADLAAHLELLDRITPRLLSLAADTGLLIHQGLASGRTVLLEGAQGALLDIDHGTYPYVTSSSTTAGGATIGAGIGPTAINGVLGVVKAYTTRVGNGPLPTEAPEPMASVLRNIGGEFGATTGRARRCGWFDAPVVRYAVRINGLTGLAVTKLDVLDTLDEIPIGVSYRLGGDELDQIPAEIGTLAKVTPVYRTMPGWKQSTAEARKLADLPKAARAYIEELESLSGAPIRFVSVGTHRNQIIPV